MLPGCCGARRSQRRAPPAACPTAGICRSMNRLLLLLLRHSARTGSHGRVERLEAVLLVIQHGVAAGCAGIRGIRDWRVGTSWVGMGGRLAVFLVVVQHGVAAGCKGGRDAPTSAAWGSSRLQGGKKCKDEFSME